MAVSDPLRDRLAALSPREKRFLFAGAIIVLLFVLYLLLRAGSGEESETVELAAAPPAAAPLATSGPPLTEPQASVPPPMIDPRALAPVPPAPLAPTADPASASGLILNGVFAGGPGGGAALIATQPGSQHLVRVGRQVIPGVTLKEVGMNYALLETAGGDIRLQFNTSATPNPR